VQQGCQLGRTGNVRLSPRARCLSCLRSRLLPLSVHSRSEAKKAIVEAGKDARQNFADNVDGARKLLLEEVQRLIGGEHPELAAPLEPTLAKFGHDLDARAARQTSELFATAARQFDPRLLVSAVPFTLGASRRFWQRVRMSLPTKTRESAGFAP